MADRLVVGANPSVQLIHSIRKRATTLTMLSQHLRMPSQPPTQQPVSNNPVRRTSLNVSQMLLSQETPP